MLRRTATVLLALPALLVPMAAPGSAAATYHKAFVTKVVDGDTVRVDVNGDRRTDATVRFLGIDTPERGRCGYTRARAAVRSLIGRRWVILRSQTGAVGLRGRLERRVVVARTGLDVATWELGRGLGVWMPREGENQATRQQHAAADAAARAGLGWFDEDRCGVGPGPAGALSMYAQYKADAAAKLGPEARRNQEFIRIRNNWTQPISIDGWNLRVGNDRSLRVPAGGPIPAGGTVTIHTGSGSNTLEHRYLDHRGWLLRDAALEGRKHLGSGSYLVDPQGDIRAWATWPCPGTCSDPTGGALRLSEVRVDPPGPDSANLNAEYIAITNGGSAPLRTGDYVVEVGPWVYEFPPDHWLQPGQTVRLHGGDGRDQAFSRHLDARVPVLPNDKGRVLLRSYSAVTVDCVAWGGVGCPVR